MANVKIGPELEPVILKLAGAGKTTRQIAAALKARGCSVGHVAVAAFLKRTRQQRGETTKAAVRDKLAPSLPGDLDDLQRERAAIARMARKLGAEIEAMRPTAKAAGGPLLRYLRLVDRLTKLTDLCLHYAGADTPDPVHDEAASTRVLDRIGRLLDSPIEDEPGPTKH